MSLRITHSRSGYSGRVTPTTKRLKLLPKVRITCRLTRTGMHIKIRPRKRGQKLRSTIGPKLQLGVANPSKASIRLRISFTAE